MTRMMMGIALVLLALAPAVAAAAGSSARYDRASDNITFVYGK